MSTRASIHFTNAGSDTIVANVYRHGDGYPESGGYGVLPDLKRFFEDVTSQTGEGNRFNDPSYLAAKFVVWQAGKNAGSADRPLDFMSVGVQVLDPDDIEYVFTVESQTFGPPKVTWKAVE